MLVRSLIGRNAGEVIDVAAPAARQMIADGRAVDIRTETAPRRKRAGRTRKPRRTSTKQKE